MMLNHRFLLTCGLVILSVAVLFGGASAQSSTRSSAATKYHRPIQARHGLYNRYTAPVVPVAPIVRPGCYLPSDGCPNEYSVQN
jgi:hypothetical protein